MTLPKQSAVFLERTSYRQRRLIDAARLLPVLGMILLALPLLWRKEQAMASLNADALLYVFGVWVFLIVASALISTKIRDDDASPVTDPMD